MSYKIENNITDKEFAQRLTKCFILFGEILPIYDSQSQAYFRLVFGKDVSEVLPKFFHDLSIQCARKRTETTPYLIFLKESLDHILGYSNEMPEVNYPNDKLEKLMKKRISNIKETQ